LNSTQFAEIFGGVLAVATLYVGWWFSHSDLKVAQRNTWRNRIRELEHDSYAKRDSKSLYRAVDSMALDGVTNYRRLQERNGARLNHIEEIRKSHPDIYQEALENAKNWVTQVGIFAEAAHREKLPLRAFMQTNHLALIRESALALPWLIVERRVTGAAVDQRLFNYAAAISDLAKCYNEMARQQRQPVYFSADEFHGPYGPICKRPSLLRRGFWNIARLFFPNLRLNSLRVAITQRTFR